MTPAPGDPSHDPRLRRQCWFLLAGFILLLWMLSLCARGMR